MFTWCQRKFHFYSHSPPITTAVCSLSALPLTFMLLTQRAIRKEKGKKAKSLTSTSFSLDSKQVSCYLVPRFSGCGPWASSIRITLKLVRNAKSWPPPQSSWSRICILTDSQDTNAFYSLRSLGLIKRNEIELFVVRWMDLESVIKSEVSQKEKNKYRMLTHIYGI